jgi:hypothetical protein
MKRYAGEFALSNADLESENQRLLESGIQKNLEVDRMRRALTLAMVPIDILYEMMRTKHLFVQSFQVMVRVAWEEGHKCLDPK